eukprot:1139803-Pelagomonas_calceolata.AAC.2
MRNVSRFRIRAHTLKVETAAWDTWNAPLCGRCSCDAIQDEAHAFLVCKDADFCALRRRGGTRSETGQSRRRRIHARRRMADSNPPDPH